MGKKPQKSTQESNGNKRDLIVDKPDDINSRTSVLSLKSRLILSSLVILVIIIPLFGFAVSDAFETQLRASKQEQMKAYVYSVLSELEIEDKDIYMPDLLLENQFNNIDSGLYAFVTDSQTIKWQSVSTLTSDFSEIVLREPQLQLGDYALPVSGQFVFFSFDYEQQQHFIIQFGVIFELEQSQFSQRLIISIIKDDSSYQMQLQAFNHTLWFWLILIIVSLTCIQIAWLFWILKPLFSFRKELHDIEKGKKSELNLDYPSELNIVAKGFNSVLNAKQIQQTRYQNSLSDLAHSLKTPLAVIQSSEKLPPEVNQQAQTINEMITRQLNRAKTSSNSAWRLSVDVDSVVAKLINALQKIYRDSKLNINCDIAENISFLGEEGDLNEVLGNLIDNACKAAKSNIYLTITQKGSHQLLIVIEDDGLGISEEKQSLILSRGVRADTYQSGHGIGLAIVKDIIDTYRGSISISNSLELGGARFEIII